MQSVAAEAIDLTALNTQRVFVIPKDSSVDEQAMDTLTNVASVKRETFNSRSASGCQV